MQESFGYAVSALALAIIFIYMILASQFKSFLQPLALMTSLPLTLIGVVLALLMFGSTLCMFSVIGIVLLMGLVTKNAILLVDFAIRARHGLDGAAPLDREDALLLAARVRLRPILMTTLAMIFGMVPLAFALTEGSEQRAPMGQAVIGGVITSSLLTLVVVPVVYCYMDDLAQVVAPQVGRAARAPPAGPAGSRSVKLTRIGYHTHRSIHMTTQTPTMSFEQARFNMIEQQIRPWDVLDSQVLDLLAVVHREDFVPAAHTALAFADMELPADATRRWTASACWRPRSKPACCRTWPCKPTDKVLEIGTGSGYMAALLAQPGAARGLARDRPRRWPSIARDNLQNAGISNVEVRTADAAANGFAACADRSGPST